MNEEKSKYRVTKIVAWTLIALGFAYWALGYLGIP